MKYSWGRVKQVSAMMECYDLQCRDVLPVLLGSGADADNNMAHLVTFIHS
jgi:hypothetical protein